MVNIVVSRLDCPPVAEQRVEVVERKGLGHPDFICDSIMERVSVELSQEYLRRFGTVLHHNIDKGMLAAGGVEIKFGGGVVKTPMLLIFGDRAVHQAQGEEIPVAEIAVNTAKKWIKDNLRFVDPEKDVRYQVELKEGSAELTDIFKREVLGANDTSAAVGYAPLTPTETLVLETEKHLNSPGFKREYPGVGEDIKVMGLRQDRTLHLTVAAPLIDRFVESEKDYFKQKQELLEEIKTFTRERTELETHVYLNTLDTPHRGVNGIYLTVTGTSAEDADSGQVGRGNRVNGVIPLNRPVSSEAAAGKNPVSHIGKIYNLLSHQIASKIYQEIPGLKEVYVWLLSQIGQPINQPKIVSVQLQTEKKEDPRKQTEEIEEIEEIIHREMENIPEFCTKLARGEIPIC